MLNYDKLEELLAQYADWTSGQQDPVFVFAEEGEDGVDGIQMHAASGVSISFTLDDDVITATVDLGDVSEARRQEVYEELLECNLLWGSSSMRFAVSGGHALMIQSWRPEELEFQDFGAALNDIRTQSNQIAPLIMSDGSSGGSGAGDFDDSYEHMVSAGNIVRV